MIRIDDYDLLFQFPEVHDDAEMAIQFRRTLRVPDNGKIYVLPPSFRAFPLLHIEDCEDQVAKAWIERGGVIMPLYQAEAMWIAFSGGGWAKGYPFAVKIAAGKVNALSGQPWKPELDPGENDYIVVPRQPRLDGFCIARRIIRQFVAMEPGSGYTVEEQLTGKAEHGGLQIIAYPMKPERYQRTVRSWYEQSEGWLMRLVSSRSFSEPRQEPPYFRRPRRIRMGLGAGGRMKQPIYKDPYGIDAWDQSVSSHCFVTLANALQWQEITGQPPPTEPPTAADYAETGLPWFDHYATDLETLPGSPRLGLIESVGEIARAKGDAALGPDEEVNPDTVIKVKDDEPPRS